MEEFRYKFLNYLKTINYKKFIMPSFLLLINLSSFMFLFTMINRKEEGGEGLADELIEKYGEIVNA